MTKKKLEELADRSGKTMIDVLDKAIEEYRQKEFLRETNRAYAALRKNEKLSKALDGDISSMDSTLIDGLDSDENWEEKPIRSKKRKK